MITMMRMMTTMITTMMAMTTNLFGIMENILSIAMEVCFGRGLVSAISAVMELASLAVAARVGILAAIGVGAGGYSRNGVSRYGDFDDWTFDKFLKDFIFTLKVQVNLSSWIQITQLVYEWWRRRMQVWTNDSSTSGRKWKRPAERNKYLWKDLPHFVKYAVGSKSTMFKTRASYQELVKMPSLKSRSILVSGGHRLSNLVPPSCG